jgi:hypothetical protein
VKLFDVLYAGFKAVFAFITTVDEIAAEIEGAVNVGKGAAETKDSSADD